LKYPTRGTRQISGGQETTMTTRWSKFPQVFLSPLAQMLLRHRSLGQQGHQQTTCLCQQGQPTPAYRSAPRRTTPGHTTAPPGFTTAPPGLTTAPGQTTMGLTTAPRQTTPSGTMAPGQATQGLTLAPGQMGVGMIPVSGGTTQGPTMAPGQTTPGLTTAPCQEAAGMIPAPEGATPGLTMEHSQTTPGLRTAPDLTAVGMIQAPVGATPGLPGQTTPGLTMRIQNLKKKKKQIGAGLGTLTTLIHHHRPVPATVTMDQEGLHQQIQQERMTKARMTTHLRRPSSWGHPFTAPSSATRASKARDRRLTSSVMRVAQSQSLGAGAT